MADSHTTALFPDRNDDGEGYQAYRDESMELSLLSRDGFQRRHRWMAKGAPRPFSTALSESSQFWVYSQMAAFYIAAVLFMGIHLAFYLALNGKPESRSIIKEPLQAALGNILAIFVEISLLSGIAVAYDQSLWRLFRRKALKAVVIDKLATLVTSPWNLFRREIAVSAPKEWVLGGVCFSIVIAAVFPPGAMEVHFKPEVLPVRRRVPMLNMSDWGNGSLSSFGDHALFMIDADFTQRDDQILPSLKLMANGALAMGSPLHPGCYNATSCQYVIQLHGPAFNCTMKEAPANFSDKCTLLFEAVDHSVRERDPGKPVLNNSFRVSWRTETRSQKQIELEGCEKPKSIDCSTAFGTYIINVRKNATGPPTFQRSFHVDESLHWTDASPILTSFHEFFSVNNSLGLPVDKSRLTREFSRTQAYALREAAVQALEGNVIGSRDIVEYYKQGVDHLIVEGVDYLIVEGGTLVLGSKLVNRTESLRPRVNIAPENITRFLEDVVISAAALNFSQSEPIDILEGDETFVFSKLEQFYVPYAACLVVTLAIYIVGIRDLRSNGVSAGNSFLQWVTTTQASERLHDLAKRCSLGGQENFSEELRNLKLRFEVRRRGEEVEDGPSKVLAGFGCPDEIEPFADV